MYIKGVGCTKFDSQIDASQKLAYYAVSEAIEDSGISAKDIDAVIVSSSDANSRGERQRLLPLIINDMLHLKVPVINCSAVCAGGGVALWTANNLGRGLRKEIDNRKDTGITDSKNDSTNYSAYDNLLVVGVDKLLVNSTFNMTDDIMMAGEYTYEQLEGLNFPAQYALASQQHMLAYGTTKEDFSLVAFKNHENGFLNPKARFYKKKITLRQINDSPVVASPLRLFDCSSPVNGAAAVILTREKTDVEIAGSGFSVDRLPAFESSDLTSWSSAKKAAEQAFSEARITPDDIDVAEVHDAFTPAEIIAYEDIGFAKKGEGCKLIRDKTTFLDGKIPVNTSGGLKAKGHPISATGLSQIYELTKQLRNEAGERQVSNAKYALSHNVGGAGSSSVVSILRKV